jgi:hypothetical protein
LTGYLEKTKTKKSKRERDARQAKEKKKHVQWREIILMIKKKTNKRDHTG